MHLIHDQNNSKKQIWASKTDHGKGPVWEFFVYGLYRSNDPRVVPSLGMACELLGVDPRPILEVCPCLGES